MTPLYPLDWNGHTISTHSAGALHWSLKRKTDDHRLWTVTSINKNGTITVRHKSQARTIMPHLFILHSGSNPARYRHKRRKSSFRKRRRNPVAHTHSEWRRFNALAKKMERIAKQRGRSYTRVDDLPKKEATEFRKLKKLGQDFESRRNCC